MTPLYLLYCADVHVRGLSACAASCPDGEMRRSVHEPRRSRRARRSRRECISCWSRKRHRIVAPPQVPHYRPTAPINTALWRHRRACLTAKSSTARGTAPDWQSEVARSAVFLLSGRDTTTPQCYNEAGRLGQGMAGIIIKQAHSCRLSQGMAGVIIKQCHACQERHAHHLVVQSF
jgi:hypothetical protein